MIFAVTNVIGFSAVFLNSATQITVRLKIQTKKVGTHC